VSSIMAAGTRNTLLGPWLNKTSLFDLFISAQNHTISG
jgi:hypothetical protein